MVETTLAVVFLAFVFLALFSVAHLLEGKILVEHAAMRVARARAVGFNDFICLKAARIAVIPAAGERLWPGEDDEEFTLGMERARIHTYLEAPDEGRAAGLLDYEGWHNLHVDAGDGGQSIVTMRMKTDWLPFKERFKLEGKAGVEAGASYYLQGAE